MLKLKELQQNHKNIKKNNGSTRITILPLFFCSISS